MSYHKELSKLRQSGSKEAFDPEQGKKNHSSTGNNRKYGKQVLFICSGEDRMFMQSVVLIKKLEKQRTILSVVIFGQVCVIR